jgi:PLD-like domain
MDVQIVGVRVPYGGIEDFRGALWDTLRHRGGTLRVLTAYWSPQTFDFLEELEACGVDRTKLLLALNPAGFTRSSVERAEAYATGQPARELRMAKADGILHPKLVLVERSAKACEAFIGSSNFTAQGLTWNVELNVWLRVEDTDSSDNPIEILSGTFDALFETATWPTSDDFSRLTQAAPSRAQFERETPLSKLMTQALEHIATIGTEPTALPSIGTGGNGGRQHSNVPPPSTDVERRLARLFPDPAERQVGMGMLAALIERVESQYGADHWAATVQRAAEVNIVIGALYRLRLVERSGRGVVCLPVWHLNSRLRERILSSGGPSTRYSRDLLRSTGCGFRPRACSRCYRR